MASGIEWISPWVKGTSSINPAMNIDPARSDDRAAGDDGAARPNTTGAINAAGANNSIRLFDRGHHSPYYHEGGDGGYNRLFHLDTP
jgi:hypothetical protein